MRKFALLAATAIIATAPAFAQTQQERAQAAQAQNAQSQGGTQSAPAAGARAEVVNATEFARMAAMSDMYELESSRLAAQRSQNTQVKEFAQHMMRDHQKTTTELQQMIRQASAAPLSGMQMPQSLDQRHQAMVQQLQGAQGAQFDRLYIQQQVQAHQMAVDMFRNYSQSGDNAALKQWASQTLPSLQQHLQQAQQLQRSSQG
jgi:putative membrane protein